MLNIALPKGRLSKDVNRLFHTMGFGFEFSDEDRRLILKDPSHDLCCLLVKPSDVGIYVEHGAADVGVVGSDVLLENDVDVYELLDLKLGRCRMVEAAPQNWEEDEDSVLRVATKYPRIARHYYASVSRSIEIIKLHGSIELAPLSGLSDVIVDLVETGNTLRENHLSVVAEIMPISARLIANKASCKFKESAIKELTRGLQRAVESQRKESVQNDPY